MARFTDAEWIMLSEIFRGEEERCHKLLKAYPEEDLFEQDWHRFVEEGIITKAQHKKYIGYDPEIAERYVNECNRKEIGIITPESEYYPQSLLQYLHPPVVLYAVGDLSLLSENNTLSVVGTRKASEYGRQTAFVMSREVASKGIVIISGCAVGIDGCAHRGALAAEGKTIAVLGCGMDVNYPAEHFQLRRDIVKKGGLLITEYPPGTKPQPGFFPHRNRLMAGLSRAVLVAEAPYRSGSLITAEHAIEQGKEVFCIPPYSIWDANCSGVTRYLRDGATPIFSPADILLHYFTLEPSLLSSEHLLQAALDYSDSKPGKPKAKRSAKPKAEKEKGSLEASVEILAEQEPQEVQKPQHDSSRWVLPPQITDDRFREVFGKLTEHPIELEQISADCELPVYEVIEVLSELEVLGFVESHSGSRYSVKFAPKF